MDRFDLVVVGAGPGGSAAALRADALGLSVACVDRRSAPGGTCLHVGCIPSKALLESSWQLDHARSGLARHGVRVGQVELDLAAMMKRKERIVGQIAKGMQSLFTRSRIQVFEGSARIESPETVRVRPASGPDRVLEARHILIATGSRPRSLPGAPFDGKRIISSEEALRLDRVPESLLVVGAGAVGLELGSVWSRLGSSVTVVESAEGILPEMERGIAEEAASLLSRQGLELRTGVRVEDLSVRSGEVRTRLGSGEELWASLALVAIGRVPCTRDLGLEQAGVELGAGSAVKVDQDLASTVPSISAIGDAIEGPMLAHRAEEEGMALAESLAGRPRRVRHLAYPEVVYLHPEVASAGRTAARLEALGIPFQSGESPYLANGRARTTGEIQGRVRLHCRPGGGRLLGVHILGASAGELASEAALAINREWTAADLASSPQAHPTFGEVLRSAALDAAGRAVHG